MPRILILTASMGEGHNTAARNIRAGLEAEGVSPDDLLVADPYTRTNPVINKLMQKGYATAINRYPHAWKVVFELLSKRGVVEGMSPMLAELTGAVRGLIEEFRPEIVVSTYPVFSFLIGKIRKKDSEMRMPFYTVITDSTLINSAWFRWPSDGWIVADRFSGKALREHGIEEAKIHELGFPVSLTFENLAPAPDPQDGIWKVIYFPGGRLPHTMTTLEALGSLPNLELTVITGHRRGVFRSLQEAGVPQKGRLLGWTDEMPKLMASHHLFIGKAGGATVQEAIAAQIPFLVNHVVPGQEEGNIALIEQSGIGQLATGSPIRMRDLVCGARANGGALWQGWRHNLGHLKKPSATRGIARFLLQHAP